MRGGIITDRESVNSFRSCHAQSTPRTMTSAMDYEQARFNMVEQQVRTWDVLDQHVLDLLFEVKREEFVPAAYRSLAFADLELPLANGARMWAPKLEARVVQELKLKPAETVLEVGTGSGYLAALLARRTASVTTVEIDAVLSAEAAATLARTDAEPSASMGWLARHRRWPCPSWPRRTTVGRTRPRPRTGSPPPGECPRACSAAAPTSTPSCFRRILIIS